MGLLKILGGVIVAGLGFAGMVVAIMRYFIGQMQDIFSTPLDPSSGSLIALGIISLMVFIGGVYLILHYGQ